jgi:protein TonB
VKSRARSIRAWIFGGSVALHAAFAVAAILIPKPERAETAAIELADIKKKKEPPKPPPPPPPPEDKPKPPPPPPRAQPKAKAESAAPKAEATPQNLQMSEDGFADLGGIALGNAGPGGDGVAMPTAAATRAVGGGAPPAKTVTKKGVEQLAPAGPDVCTQPVVRPRRTVGVQAKYTKDARQGEIEGLVRIEVTVSETGHVIATRVLSGLGYGLDEAALDAARRCVFEPATLCGRPVVGTAVVAQRFELE